MKMAEGDSIAIKIGAENDKIHRYAQPQNKSATESSYVVPDPGRNSSGCDGNANSTIAVDDNSKEENLRRLENTTKDIVDLTDKGNRNDTSKDSITTGNTTTANNSDTNKSASDHRSIIDLVPVAKEMWKFET